MRSRTGFTLIELMVSMALMLFIMVILSQAFVLSLETFSAMKGIGDMQRNLRTAEVILRDDLGQDHFTGKRRLSDPNIVTNRPSEGFFAVRGSVPTPEGADAFGVPSFRAVDQMLYMTVKRKGNRQENFFTTALQGDPAVLGAFFGQSTAYTLPANELPTATWSQPYAGGPTGFYASQWAEVCYYLVRSGSTEEPNNPTSTIGTPTYSLFRTQFVMVPDRTNVNGLYVAASYNVGILCQSTFSGMSCNPGATALTFYSPGDAAVGQRVIPDVTTFNAAGDARFTNVGNLVMPNVISFQVQIMPIGATAFTDGIYDTTQFGAGGYLTTGLNAIQVTLRVWDNKTRQTRQLTLVQDL